jgi:hypothetical protein
MKPIRTQEQGKTNKGRQKRREKEKRADLSVIESLVPNMVNMQTLIYTCIIK